MPPFDAIPICAAIVRRDGEAPLACVLVDEAQFLTAPRSISSPHLAEIEACPCSPTACAPISRRSVRGLGAAAGDRRCAHRDQVGVRMRPQGDDEHARRANGEAVREGAQTEIGGNDRYVAMCRRHFIERTAAARKVTSSVGLPRSKSVMICGLLAIPRLAFASGAALAQTPPPAYGKPASISFVDMRGIEDFQAMVTMRSISRTEAGNGIYATIMGPCLGLSYATRIGVKTRGSSSLDKYGSLLVDGDECRIDELVTSGPPPKKVKKAKRKG